MTSFRMHDRYFNQQRPLTRDQLQQYVPSAFALEPWQRMSQRDTFIPTIQIVDRLIERYSNPGETVYDPFGGLMTVPYRAVLKGRKGRASELNTGYFFDGVQYLRAAEREVSMPSLFDGIEMED